MGRALPMAVFSGEPNVLAMFPPSCFGRDMLEEFGNAASDTPGRAARDRPIGCVLGGAEPARRRLGSRPIGTYNRDGGARGTAAWPRRAAGDARHLERWRLRSDTANHCSAGRRL